MLFDKRLFGERLKEVRLKNGDKQPKVADLIEVSIPQVSDMERGKKTTTLEKFALLCEHYKVSADYLLGLTDDPKPYGRKDERT